MTNKPMLSVERELLERAVSAVIVARGPGSPTERDLRALLEKPVPFPGYPPVPDDRKLPAAQHQGEPVTGKCDQAVFESGSSVCLVDIPKETAEVICRNISAATGWKIDWHYIGGREIGRAHV